MAHIYLRKDGSGGERWRVQFRRKNCPTFSITFFSKNLAEKFSKKFEKYFADNFDKFFTWKQEYYLKIRRMNEFSEWDESIFNEILKE